MRGRGCPSCSKTYKQNKWLDSVGIPNDPKHREVSVRVPNRTRPIRVDGYDPKTNTVYEFNGDSWHGNPALFEPTDINHQNGKTYGELYIKTLAREKILKEAGYSIISIWESEFDSRT